ncbi:transmembrane protein 182 isoform X2 [Danio aesculapii]|uniref:transmembrane protein 182 isoform X2 n=1 Tax=Danio aesculapii TaxID=1142201 RepID=UPI0024BFC066|nr:transmembrane protein 182 isoform X2 [Danio aesculapii]
MHLVVLSFLAGFFGALSSVLLLGSLGSDYWLMVFESCGDSASEDISQTYPGSREQTENSPLFYHEGLFWRCSYDSSVIGEKDSVLTFWITNLPSQKLCVPAYLSHAPSSGHPNSIQTSVSVTGVLIMSVVLLFAVWVQVSDSLERYGLQRRRFVCPSLQLHVHYGPSFMLAPTAAFLCLLTGLLLLLIPSASRASDTNTQIRLSALREDDV